MTHRSLLIALFAASFVLSTGCERAICSNTCSSARNGTCEDNGRCELGTDCSDCGYRYVGGGGGGVLVPELGGITARGASAEPGGSLPPPTSTGMEPQIVGGRLLAEDDGLTMVIELDYTGPAIDEVLLFTGETLLRFPVDLAGVDSIDDIACQSAEASGYPCTQACREACACVQCDDSTRENAIHTGCAAACSIASGMGEIPGAVYESEVDLADKVYNGTATVTGLLASYPDCSGTMCRASAEEMKQARVSFGMVSVDWGAVVDMLPNMEAQVSSPPTEHRESLRSQSFPGGMLNTDICRGTIRCS